MPVRSRAVALLCALAALATACGEAAESGVNVKTIATDLTFGIPETPKPAPPANTGGSTSDPLGAVIKGGDKPDEIPGPPVRRDPCPEAPPTVFPPAAPTEITNAPAEGDYRWVLSGSQTITGVGKLRFPPFSQRSVVDVSDSAGSERFTVVEPELTFGSQYTVRTTYEIRSGGANETVDGQPIQRDGLYLVRIERIHRNNSDANTEFNPSPAILVLPQPAVLGDLVDSSGVDPVSLEAMRQTGTVTRRIRVDACGEPQDAFYVETLQDFVAADGRVTRRKYDYGIATIMGGLPIVEHIESPCVDDSEGNCSEESVSLLLDARIGQLEPKG